jgi:hypothetical protein
VVQVTYFLTLAEGKIFISCFFPAGNSVEKICENTTAFQIYIKQALKIEKKHM